MRSFRLQFVAVVLTFAMPFAAISQTPTLTEKIEVRVAGIDVVVTDRAGNVITGLTKDDFELLENKIPQPIVNFYESTPQSYAGVAVADAGTSPAQPAAQPQAPAFAPPPRRVVLYIDNLTLTTVERNRLIAEMKKFVGETLRPGDEVMVATFNRLLRIPLTFSSDRAAIEAALDKITGEAAQGEIRIHQMLSIQQDIHAAIQYDQRVGFAKGYAQNALNDVQQSAKAVKALMKNLAGLEGKKVVVLASEGFPMQPGVELFEYIDRLGQEISQRDLTRNKPVREVTTPNAPGQPRPAPPPSDPMPELKFGMPRHATAIVNAKNYDASKDIESIASTANANGVTIYTILAGALDGGSSAGADRTRSISNSVVMQSRSNTEMGLKSIAALTGGTASVLSSKHKPIFENIRRDLDSYYSLGYRPKAGEGERAIQVRVRKPGRYNVRSRQTYVQKSAEEEMADRVISNLLSKPMENALKVKITTDEGLVQRDGKYRVPVKIHVPMDSLTLLEQSAGGLEGGFDVFVVAADAGGSLTPVVHRTQKVAVGAHEKETAKGKSYTYSVDFLMNREITRVSVAIIDSTSNVASFARYER